MSYTSGKLRDYIVAGNITFSVFQKTYSIHKIWIPEEEATGVIKEIYFKLNVQATANLPKPKLILNNTYKGVTYIKDVSAIKQGILSMLKMRK